MDVAPVYETVASTEDPSDVKAQLAAGEIDYVTFTSSSTVKNLVKLLGDADLLKKTKVVAIGPVTAKTCESLGITPAAVAEEYTIDGLVETLRSI